mmetsp:Transcript_17540/g.30904  ORF Transcript_17540/g.30904 Transcript_17540/m.30904 type:complete len:313 (-) Transcript_17540:851-1789(-)
MFSKALSSWEGLFIHHKAVQDGQNGHPKDFFELSGHSPGQHGHQDQGGDDGVQLAGVLVIQVFVCAEDRHQHNESLHDEEHGVRDDGDRPQAEHVAGHQLEALHARGAEPGAAHCRLDVGVLVHEAHALLQAPEAALAGADHRLGHLVVRGLGLLLAVGEERADGEDDGQDQRAEGGRAHVEPGGLEHGHHEGAGPDLALVVHKVPLRDGQRQGNLPHGHDELGGPEQLEDQEEHLVLLLRREVEGPVLVALVVRGGGHARGGLVHQVHEEECDEHEGGGGLQQRPEEHCGHGRDRPRGLLHNVLRQLDLLP